MKKILNITALVLCVAVVIGMGISSLADASIDRVSPNWHKETPISDFRIEGYVQIKPSYNENGKHAQVGILRLSSPSSTERVKAQTPVGTHEGDSRILQDLCVLHIDNLYVGQNEVELQTEYKNLWQPHTGDPTRPWAHPFSFSPIENLIEPQLMK